MPEPVCSEEEFISGFRTLGPTRLAKHLGISIRGVFARRRSIEQSRNITLEPIGSKAMMRKVQEYPQRLALEIQNGCILVGSDWHFWPGFVSTAFKAFVEACRTFQPKAVVLNGDVIDGSRLSRHPRIGWDHTPAVKEELEFAQAQLAEIAKAAPNARKIWTLGNHDARLETRLANAVPEVEGLMGTSLQDHFPEWSPAWSVWVNNDRRGPVIKHRFKGGFHSGHNNAVYSGRTMVCGHDHQLKVTTFVDYDGIRWGVHGGFMSAPYWPMFSDYTEDNPVNWTSGFIKLNFHEGDLLWPEIIRVYNEEEGLVEYGGRIHAV